MKRNIYYRKIQRQATLFDEPEEEIVPLNSILTVQKKIKVLIHELEFHYGGVIFNYSVDEMNVELQFQIENIEFRPEFEVLKPYFTKILKTKSISVELMAEFENGKLVSQLALSSDIDRINKEVLDGVKFQFFNRELLNKPNIIKTGMLTWDELQEQDKVYPNADDLLQEILRNKNFKHVQHIQYLADRHESQLMKVRFVLNPFSLVFLLASENSYFIVLETLDTEEATYIWRTSNDKVSLIEEVKQVDNQLTMIKDNGRKVFLENSPLNFSRIMHDYSDRNKGFVIWKSALEAVV